MAPPLSRRSLPGEPPPPSERVTVLVGRIRDRWRLGRALGRGCLWLLGAATFAAALGGAAVLHLDTGPTRRVTRALVNEALREVLEGRIELGPISRISLSGADLEEVSIFDPDGRRVIHAWGVSGEIDLPRLLRTALDGERALVVHLPRARVERAAVTLVDRGDGAPTIASAFIPRSTAPPDPLAQPVRVGLPVIAIGRVDASGALGVPIEATASRLRAKLAVSEAGVALDVEDTGIALRTIVPGGARVAGNFHLHTRWGDARVAGEPELVLRADASGEASGVGFSGRWSMEDERMKVQLDVPRATPTALRAVSPDLPVLTAASAVLTLEGPLEALELAGRVELEPVAGARAPAAVAMIEGVASLSPGIRAHATYYARDVDLSALRHDLPRTRVDGRGRIRARVDDGGPRLSLDLATDATTIGAEPVPALDAHVDVSPDEVLASVRAHEPGATVDGVVRILPDASLRFGAAIRSAELRAAPRLRGQLGGALRAAVRGEMADGSLSATIDATTSRLRGPAISVDHARLTGTMSGPPPDFEISLDAVGRGVTVGDGGGLELSSATLRARGPLLSPWVTAELSDRAEGVGRASGRVDVRARSLSGASFSLERDGERVEGRLARATLGPEGPSIGGVSLSGTGVTSLRGSLSVQRGELLGELRGDQLDLARVARLVGVRAPVGGVMDVDVSVRESRGGRVGHVEVELERGRAAVVDGVSARLSASFDGPRVEASGFVRLIDEATAEERAAAEAPQTAASRLATLCDGAIAEVRLSSLDARLSGPLLEPSTWRDAVGAAEVSAERWSLHCLARRFPFLIPLSDARGTLTTRVRVARAEGDPVPSVESLYVRTHDLELVGPKPLLGEAAWATRAIDLEATAALDASTGRAPFEVKLFDDTFLATIDGSVDLGPLWRDGAGAVELSDLPFEVSVNVPRRGFDELSSLPSPLAEAVPPIDGEFRAYGSVLGTLRDPQLSLEARLFGVAPIGDAAAWTPPIDGEVSVVYQADGGRLVVASSLFHEGATVAQVIGGAHVPYEALRSGGDAPVPWRGGVSASLSELPIGAIPALSDRGVSGTVSGTATMTGLNDNPTLEADVTLPFLSLGETFFDGRVRAKVRPATEQEVAQLAAGSIDAATAAPALGLGTLEVELRDQEDGTLELLGHARVVWEDRTIPVIDGSQRGGVAMSAERFRLAALQPGVAGTLTKLDGYLGGQAVLEWGDEAGTGRIASADLTLREGVVYVPQIGQELRAVAARLRSDGPGDFVVEGVEAEGLSGRVTASGRASLDGLALDEADVIVEIAEEEELPLTFEGVPLGRASGRVLVHLANVPASNRLEVGVFVPDFRLSMSSIGTRSVQSLDDHPDVSVSAPIGPPEEEERAASATRWEVTVDVDRLVVQVADLAEVEVRTPSEEIPSDRALTPVVLRLEDRLTASGDVVVTRGSFDFLGKQFEIDQGLLRLREEDAANPFVNGSAHWEGPDGGRVFLDYVGLALPITDEKMRFRSDPSRSEREILATLLFGDSLSDIPEGGSSSGAGDTGSGNVANTVSASVVSGGLNQILKNSALRRVSAKLGTTDEGNFRTGVEVKISDKVTAEVANERIEGAAQTGGAAAAASGTVAGSQQLNEGALRYQFHKNWSVRGSFGVRSGETAGTQGLLGLDLLWQYRY